MILINVTYHQANIKELFGGEGSADSAASASASACPCPGGAEAGGGGGELETALAACEDEADAAAARAARIEQRTDLAEFDETLPLDDDAPPAPAPAPDPGAGADAARPDELTSLMKQVSPPATLFSRRTLEARAHRMRTRGLARSTAL